MISSVDNLLVSTLSGKRGGLGGGGGWARGAVGGVREGGGGAGAGRTKYSWCERMNYSWISTGAKKGAQPSKNHSRRRRVVSPAACRFWGSAMPNTSGQRGAAGAVAPTPPPASWPSGVAGAVASTRPPSILRGMPCGDLAVSPGCRLRAPPTAPSLPAQPPPSPTDGAPCAPRAPHAPIQPRCPCTAKCWHQKW